MPLFLSVQPGVGGYHRIWATVWQGGRGLELDSRANKLSESSFSFVNGRLVLDLWFSSFQPFFFFLFNRLTESFYYLKSDREPCRLLGRKWTEQMETAQRCRNHPTLSSPNSLFLPYYQSHFAKMGFGGYNPCGISSWLPMDCFKCFIIMILASKILQYRYQ